MAFGTGRSGIVDWMAIGTGSTSMAGAVSIATTGMIEGCIPITGVVTLRAVCSKHSSVDGRFSMTARAKGGNTPPDIIDVAPGTVEPGVRPGKGEGGQVVVKGGEW